MGALKTESLTKRFFPGVYDYQEAGSSPELISLPILGRHHYGPGPRDMYRPSLIVAR